MELWIHIKSNDAGWHWIPLSEQLLIKHLFAATHTWREWQQVHHMVTVDRVPLPHKPSQATESRYPENEGSTEEVPVREILSESVRRQLRQLCFLVWTLKGDIVR